MDEIPNCMTNLSTKTLAYSLYIDKIQFLSSSSSCSFHLNKEFT